jgi:hypothetical protein
MIVVWFILTFLLGVLVGALPFLIVAYIWRWED